MIFLTVGLGDYRHDFLTSRIGQYWMPGGRASIAIFEVFGVGLCVQTSPMLHFRPDSTTLSEYGKDSSSGTVFHLGLRGKSSNIVKREKLVEWILRCALAQDLRASN